MEPAISLEPEFESMMESRNDEPEVVSDTKKSLRRRSSVSNSVRRSQSIVGISFEDQISALDTNAPIQDRLCQAFNLSLLATCKAMQNQYDESEDDNLSALVDHVRSELVSKGPIVNKDDPLITTLSEKVSIMSGLVQEASAPVQVLPPRLKNLQDYHEQINNESNQWKDLHLTRKNRQKSANMNLKSVMKGERVIDDSTRSDLPRAEDAGLRSASDGLLELERLRQQSLRLISIRDHLKVQLAKRRRKLDEMSAELDHSASVICTQSASLRRIDVEDVKNIFTPMDVE